MVQEDNESKGERRRREIIEATKRCFLSRGFHNTSIARIAKEAGMSTGHISHYFPQKELIIETIVKREEDLLAELLQSLDKKSKESNFLDALSDEMDAMIDYALEPGHAALRLEIVAEAARNPKIASVLRESAQHKKLQFVNQVSSNDKDGILNLEENEQAIRTDIMALLLSGLMMRSIYTDIDRKHMARMITQILTVLWKE
jgi:TetR/AcrR family transcriptional repressor of uid operon